MLLISHAPTFLAALEPASIDLAVIDPPYYNMVKDQWDRQWKTEDDYLEFMIDVATKIKRALKPTGSLLMFNCLGKHGHHPFLRMIPELEKIFYWRDLITWGKRRGYGCADRYLYAREELLWMSADPKHWIFNVPLLDTKRGYSGWGKYAAKSDYYRRTNVWTDIGELMKPKRACQKPTKLLDVIIQTHSNAGDTVLDCFAGTGATMISAEANGRNFIGCDSDPDLAQHT